jgi:hypothetical protein
MCDTLLHSRCNCYDVQCGACKAQYCFNCNKPWHGRTSCAKVAESELEQWMKGNDVRRYPSDSIVAVCRNHQY